MRHCPCGAAIDPTTKTIEWGETHGRDLATWPTKCNACLVDWAIGLFDLVEDGGLPEKPASVVASITCAYCTTTMDPTRDHFFQNVPGIGDLCMSCHALWGGA